ncbi:MAG TPA: M23 family metallopeptidase, partial [Flavobacteriia bacterium]|nr:M23 family metallopeptidase [Flavobacteriia bacterium]
MGRILISFVLFFNLSTLVAQKKYPTDYFAKPLEIPLILSGTFGELRTNHFHSGLDIKTQGRQGFNVHASAKGYVSRIKISHWGYGKVLYLTHPNGYTTVYAHLKKFAPKIEAYVKKHQYEKESFTLQLFPKADELVVEKNEIIAYSGNTGGSGGPHLHFEIRSGNSNPINPMLFGIEIPDTRAP